MAFVNLEKQLFENTTVMLKPRVTVISSSVGAGVTGSAHIYPIRSERVRNFYDPSFIAQLYNQGNQEAFVEAVANSSFIGFANYGATGVENIINYIDALEDIIPKNTIQNKTIPICRFDSPTFFNKEHTIINNIVKVLQPHHQHRYPDSGLHYGNYHTLNFFTGSEVPNDACLIYPNVQGVYHPTNAFSLDFWINPRYDNQTAGAEYHAGTIFHMSSSIALSLVSGSQTDEFGKVSSFKLLLQLSQSADYNPRTVDLSDPNNGGVYPRDLIFTSSHELNKNHWHHVCVRWGGQNVNNYSGSIVIDDKSTSFYIPSASIHTDTYTRIPGNLDYDTIVIGNFFDSFPSVGQGLFNSTAADANGTYDRGGSEPSSAIQEAAFTNGLNAEIHDIKFFNKYLNNQELEFLKYNGISNQPILNDNGENVSGNVNIYDSLKFYVPVSFLPYQIRKRNTKIIAATLDSADTDGKVPVDGYSTSVSYPYMIRIRTFHPFNIDMSNRVNVREVNLQNFVQEFKSFDQVDSTNLGHHGQPRLQSLTSSVVDFTSTPSNSISASRYALFEQKNHKKRNLTVLPNDNGLFTPNSYHIDRFFENYLSIEDQISNLKSRYADSVSFSSIDISNTVYLPDNPLNEIISTQGLTYPVVINDEDIRPGSDGKRYSTAESLDGVLFLGEVGPSPTDPFTGGVGFSTTSKYAVTSRIRKTYSSEMTVFDISNLYYGNRIAPGSFEIFDNSVTGSGGIVKIKLKDNENGSLYRADCLTAHATWNNVGDIYYDEGLILIKSPHMSYYCKDRTEISLTGEQNLHTLIMNVPVEMGLVNSSSNPTFKSIPPSDNINDSDKEAVYISGVNIHDNNFNIIMKAHFAQPIIKSDDDEFIIRLKQDF